ncbi:hypothetical protein TTHERM_00463130 (macronuclear) [Tetrahymena thermophila SB210]|uniref:Uncharacterized protein n=1 Tax=Tetrahymena thermophila (strain SB210) TaxID=312017 RepID=Q23PX0_TETTS|nr:hypothetical protein TTHERM_00463130 [Tetrahymena thermophila SB210]EAR98565.2 hypothetical protein TTHERM_00463130 [Tetrahymena thermophila SB210]|eukprot:XP_001018810.2 hypothetical protein TTHERM_00463130 [Tetrahymena thermophila SB210]
MEQQSSQSQIISQYSTSIQSEKDSSTDKEEKNKIIVRQQGKICKKRRKRRVRLIGVPLIIRNILQTNSDPIYVYYLIKMMKRYDPDELEKYKYFGIQSAGVGRIVSIQLDKINRFIDIELNMQSLGDQNFQHLIQLYKSYQNQDYFDLAVLLEQYQYHVYLQFNKSLSLLGLQDYNLPNLQTKIDEEFIDFERSVKNWANKTRESEIMIIALGNINLEKKFPQLKKQIFSQNLINFVSGDLQTTYEKIINYKNYDFLTNFLRDLDEIGGNGREEMERSKFILKQSMKDFNEFEFEFEDKIITLDGFKLPCKIKVELFFYDNETKQISKKPGLYYFLVNHLNFDLEVIQYLIEMRLKNQQNSLQIFNQTFREAYDHMNFEYQCYQEYFLEKFYNNKRHYLDFN